MAVGQTQRISRIMTEMREERARSTGRRSSTAAERSSARRRGATRTTSSEAAVRGYRRDNWQEQPTIVEVWSEKSTVEGVLAPVLDELGVTFRVMKGFGSFTAVMQAAEDSQRRLRRPEDRRPLHRRLGPDRALHERGRSAGAARRATAAGRQLKRIAIVKADTRRLPHFEVDLPADLQCLVRPDRGSRSAHCGADRRLRVGSARDPGRPRLGQARSGRASRGRRLVPPRVPRRGSGELVSGAGHSAGQRRGDQRRSQ